MSTKWVEKPYDAEKARILEQESGLSPLTAKLLVSRGIETVEHAMSFLKPNFQQDFHNPSLMKDMDIVIKRIYRAIQKKERIIILGDYDADGVTTTTMYVCGFEMLGIEVDYFVPNRFKDGYGINIKNVPDFAQYDLIITGDCGIKAFDAVYELSQTHQVDVIVTDHHEPVVYSVGERDRIPEKTTVIENTEEVMALPVCLAVINPKRIDCPYPGKDLSGAGIAFKVIEAMFDYLHYPKKKLYYMLDVVACGLVPDMVPMFNIKTNSFEVRNMVRLGLNIMNNNPKPWVQSVQGIKEQNQKNKNKKSKPITSTDLGFTYGPLLNAVGRLYDPRPAVEFLLEKNPVSSLEKATRLFEINKERQKLSAEVTTEVLNVMKELPEERKDYGIVVSSPNSHVGITGLVAGNVLTEYYRTTIALAPFSYPDGPQVLKGSARSIDGISVLDALMDVEKEIGPYIFGGHEQAAGITLTLDQEKLFQIAFRKAVKKQADAKGPEVFDPKKYYDLSIQFGEVTFSLLDELGAFEPFGMGNSEPIFYAGNVLIESFTILRNKDTGKESAIKFGFNQNGYRMEGITFNKLKNIEEQYANALQYVSKVPCELLGYPQINDWNGKFQFVVNEIRINTPEPSLV